MSTTRVQRNKAQGKRRKAAPPKRRRNRKPPIFFWLFVALVLGVTYFFAISILSSPVAEEPVVEDTSREEFIERLVPHAKELQKRHGILPSIILGQAILESDWGQSQLGKEYNNLFGIKAYGDGEQILLETKEFVDGKWIDIKAEFKVYPDWEASMDDHTSLFLNGVSWNPNLYQHVLQATNYKDAAIALQNAGYATDPDYTHKIIQVIETYKLYQYDET